ncbi:MAG: shikimate dehydrogenase [Bacteroides sp.]|nr:shikimate dehydrogenase [Bacteroides sp.]MCM1413139.1 shikimate dehydrogenase [Bacteroides sp.]MCM1472119.1 shikimate dehydrogenase [Bacteroides sp.]
MNHESLLFGLVGYPLGHSFSKRFFTDLFARENIPAKYCNFELKSLSQLADVLADSENLVGFNVTIPYKTAIIPMLSWLDAEAKEIGAVNTVKVDRRPDGKTCLKGYNTDIVGFTDSLRPFLPDSTTGLKALVLGSGGASKAVMAGLRKLGINPVIVSRNPSDGQLGYNDLDAAMISEHRVIVNTTPLGMWPNVDTCPDIDYDAVSADHICYDLVYNPDPTLFMQKCAEHEATTIGGLDMLHRQALAARDIWFDNL